MTYMNFVVCADFVQTDSDLNFYMTAWGSFIDQFIFGRTPNV